jgi:hypothetical protein
MGLGSTLKDHLRIADKILEAKARIGASKHDV